MLLQKEIIALLDNIIFAHHTILCLNIHFAYDTSELEDVTFAHLDILGFFLVVLSLSCSSRGQLETAGDSTMAFREK